MMEEECKTCGDNGHTTDEHEIFKDLFEKSQGELVSIIISLEIENDNLEAKLSLKEEQMKSPSAKKDNPKDVGGVCPLLSIMKNEPYQCLKGACAWYNVTAYPSSTKRECVVLSMNRHMHDTWLTIQNNKEEL